MRNGTITHEADWDPEILDNELSDDQDWFDSLPDTPFLFPLFDEKGALHPHVMVQQHNVHTLPPGDDDSIAILMEDEYDVNESMDHCVYYANLHCMVPVDQSDIKISGSKDVGGDSSLPCVHVRKAHLVTPTKLDYEALCSHFAWLPADIIWKTFRSMTQYVHMPSNMVLRHRYKASHPALNHFCREEPVATDTIVSDTPAINGRNLGSTLCWYQVSPIRCIWNENPC